MNIKISEPIRIFYDPSQYSSFPDVAKTQDQYICVFRTGNAHHPTESVIMLARSNDREIWNVSEFASASLDMDGYVFNCPRISVVEDKISIVCDTKTHTQESKCKWNIVGWWSHNSCDWTEQIDFKIEGAVPDKMINMGKKLLLGYHIPEVTQLHITGTDVRKQFVQMMAISLDKGETWRDRTTIAANHKHRFCEGSIVSLNDDRLMCFLRDNTESTSNSQICVSSDGGYRWGSPYKLPFSGHRIVAGLKNKEPFKNSLIATFRNTANRSLSLMVQNPIKNKLRIFSLDTETNSSIFNYGYSGWVENDDGSLQVVYYIQRDNPNPEIVTIRVSLS